MKGLFVLAAISFLAAAPLDAAVCVGATPCKACKTCKLCWYCNHGRGSCSVYREQVDREYAERLKKAKGK